MIIIEYSHSYPYLKYANIFQPMLPIDVFYGNNHFKGNGLLDSGATAPIFDMTVADALGLRLTTNNMQLMNGIAGNSKAYSAHVYLKLGPLPQPVKCTVYFMPKLNTPNLLGRIGIFDKFHIGFDDASHQIHMRLK
jgi:hypothetical protein